MLILTRRVGERIKIGDDITLTPLRVMGKQVRIGIDAPDAVKILRTELVGKAPDGESSEDSDGQ